MQISRDPNLRAYLTPKTVIERQVRTLPLGEFGRRLVGEKPGMLQGISSSGARVEIEPEQPLQQMDAIAVESGDLGGQVGGG